MTEESSTRIPAREVRDVGALKALSHPLRTQLWDALMAGPATASQLAERLGESSGATSYHLRQLAKHGFVEEVPGRGRGRERFWRAAEGDLSLRAADVDSPAGREAAAIFADEWLRLRYQAAARYADQRRHGLVPDEWVKASADISTYVVVTAEELAEMVEELQELDRRWSTRFRDRVPGGVPDARTVEVQFRAFPRDEGTSTGRSAS